MPRAWVGVVEEYQRDRVEECRKEWRWAVKEIAPGVLTLADKSMLELYCELRTSLRKTVRLGITPKASMVTQVRALAAEFGLLPASRSRIKASIPEKNDAFMDWLQGNRKN